MTETEGKANPGEFQIVTATAPDRSGPPGEGGTPSRRRAQVLRRAHAYMRSAGVFVALALLWIALSIASPYFLTSSNISILFLQSSTVGILAAGFTLVLLTGEIDLSFASVEALAGTVAAIIIVQRHVPVVPGILIVIGIGAGVGALNGYLTLCARLPSFIATLATLGIAQGVAFVLTGAQTVSGFPSSYLALGQ